MKQYIRLRNDTSQFLSCVYQGRAIRFAPAGQEGCQRDLLPEVAEKVLRDLGKKLVKLETSSSRDLTPTKYFGDSTWVANVTGDPDQPPEIIVGERENKITGRLEPIIEKNLKLEPRHITESMGQTEKFVKNQDLTFTTTTPNPNVELAPYERIKLPAAVAKTLLNRDRSRGHQAGMVIKAREPQPNDPSMDWDLERLNAYFNLIEPQAPRFVLTSEEELKAKAKTAAEFELDLYDAKFKAWVRCYRRAIDPNYHPPTESDISTYLRGGAPDPAESELVTETLAKSAKKKTAELMA